MQPDIVRTAVDWMRHKRGRPAELAAATGIPVKVLRNLIYGATSRPSYVVIDALRAFFSLYPSDVPPRPPAPLEATHDERSPA